MSQATENGIIYFEVIEEIPHQRIVAIISHNTEKRKQTVTPILHKDFSTRLGNDIEKAAKSLHMEPIEFMGQPFYALKIDFAAVRPEVNMMYELSIWLERKILPLCNIIGTFPVITAYKGQLLFIRKIRSAPF